MLPRFAHDDIQHDYLLGFLNSTPHSQVVFAPDTPFFLSDEGKAFTSFFMLQSFGDSYDQEVFEIVRPARRPPPTAPAPLPPRPPAPRCPATLACPAPPLCLAQPRPTAAARPPRAPTLPRIRICM